MFVPLHVSDSTPQREAESVILDLVAQQVGASLQKRRLKVGAATVEVDGADDAESVFVEIFAHQGRLKGGQVHKVARDALKLITLGRDRRAARLILAFADEEAARRAVGSSWLAEALRLWGVEVLTVEIGEDTRTGLRAAQLRQVMVNPNPAGP